MREAKEQITDRVSKSMQYLQEMGQAVTAALSNLGEYQFLSSRGRTHERMRLVQV